MHAVGLGLTAGSPPRARGRLTLRHFQRQVRGLTPACAGTSRTSNSGSVSSRAHPRVRGDVPVLQGVVDDYEGSPPRARGRQRKPVAAAPAKGLTPACAGTSCRGEGDVWREGAHPRVRGDVQVEVYALLSSLGLTPACAGTSVRGGGRPAPEWAHPRVRGDVCSRRTRTGCFWGSPPRARGRRVADPGRVLLPGLTPACAGTSQAVQVVVLFAGAHPRVRGDVRSVAAGLR